MSEIRSFYSLQAHAPVIPTDSFTPDLNFQPIRVLRLHRVFVMVVAVIQEVRQYPAKPHAAEQGGKRVAASQPNQHINASEASCVTRRRNWGLEYRPGSPLRHADVHVDRPALSDMAFESLSNGPPCQLPRLLDSIPTPLDRTGTELGPS